MFPQYRDSHRNRRGCRLNLVTPEAVEYFEKHVRPVLADNCFSCHGVKGADGGPASEPRGGMLKKSLAGRVALTPGKPEKSAIVRVLRYDGTIKMPKAKLSDKDIQSLTEWVKMGAPWPEEGKREKEKGKVSSHLLVTGRFSRFANRLFPPPPPFARGDRGGDRKSKILSMRLYWRSWRRRD